MKKLLSLLLVSPCVLANWNNSDKYLVDLYTADILANLVAPLNANSPVTALLVDNRYIQMKSQNAALDKVDIYYQYPNCIGNMYMHKIHDVNTEAASTLVGTTYLPYALVNHGVIEAVDNTVGVRNYQSYQLKEEEECANIEGSIEGINVVAYEITRYPQLGIGYDGLVQFKDVRGYVTVAQAEPFLPTTSQTLDIRFSKDGTLDYVVNGTGVPLNKSDVIVSHPDLNTYNITLPSTLLAPEKSYKEVAIQCSINEPDKIKSLQYQLGCYKVDNESVIRVRTINDDKVHDESAVSVNIKW